MARLADGVLYFVLAMAAVLPFLPAEGEDEPATQLILTLWAVEFVVVGAIQLVLLHRFGQTLGKRLLGIRIVRSDGSRAPLSRILVMRIFVPALIGNVPLVGFFFTVANYLWIFGEERRCIHDLMAETIVVKA